MCTRVTCRACGKATYSGCGRHVEEVLRGVPPDVRCRCAQAEPPGLLAALLSRISPGRGRKPS
ncbi:MAG TPA: hypothetical protein VGF41_10620 [Myxococcaceae bacterium]